MQIAISATGKDLSSAIDPRFGRAAYLLIVDPDTKAIVEIIDNQAASEAAQGAGIKAATLIADAGVEAVLTGIVGPKAAAVCEKAGIVMLNGIKGTVAEAVEQFRAEQKTSPPRQTALRQTGSQPAGPCGQGKGKGMGMGRNQGQGCGKGGCRTNRGKA